MQMTDREWDEVAGRFSIRLRARAGSSAAGILGLALVACAASGRGIPHIDASRLHRLRFEVLRPPEVRLDVLDERKLTPDPERLAVANVRDTMARALENSGVAVR